MKKHLNRNNVSASQSINDVVAAACRLAENDEIKSVHVVCNDRPTYDDLSRYHRWADVCDVTLRVDASGVAFRTDSLRYRDERFDTIATSPWPVELREFAKWRTLAADYAQGTRPVVVGNLISLARKWLGSHGRTWRAEFSAMTEGTR
jgi:hypothetical protein